MKLVIHSFVFYNSAYFQFKLLIDTIPDEETALNMGGPPLPGQRVLPPHVVNKVETDAEGNEFVG